MKRITTVLGVLILLFPLAGMEASENVAGEAFSDPSTMQDMPESWVNQPIKYDPETGKAEIVINVNRQVYQALHPLLVQFEKKTGTRIVISRGTCGISAGMMRKKNADITMLCCPPGKVDRLPGIEFHTVGIISLAVLVHRENPINDVTLQQARQIFRGDISSWSDLSDSKGQPGKNTPIQVIARRHCNKRPGHWKLLLGNKDLFSPRLQEVGAITDMINLVAANPYAIGYDVMQMVREYDEKGKIKPLKINGISPEEPIRIISGEYPLYKTYSLTTWKGEGLSNPNARRLVEYLLKHVEKVDPVYGIIPASDLRQAGWKFRGNELVGEPE
jgi:hypothetical protein